MASSQYLTGRRKYQRPQAMLWADNPGTLTNGIYVPNGFEVGQDTGSSTDESMFNQFLILSDDNRSPIDFKPNRIEKRQRMINGRMRSYHVADKLNINVSWDMLPSRSFYLDPAFNPTTGKSPYIGMGSPSAADTQYTSDGGAGGVELLDWYENHKGSFWVYLAYDKYKNFDNSTNPDDKYGHLAQYNQVIEMFFADFQYSVVKRGATNYDMWNVSVSLEEV